LDLSRGFASAAADGKFPDLRDFEKKRAVLFRALELHETKLTSAISRLTLAERTPELLERTRAATRDHASLVAQITSLDNRIMALIEREKPSRSAAGRPRSPTNSKAPGCPNPVRNWIKKYERPTDPRS
jgi:hypothetical protein